MTALPDGYFWIRGETSTKRHKRERERDLLCRDWNDVPATQFALMMFHYHPIFQESTIYINLNSEYMRVSVTEAALKLKQLIF